MGSQTHVPSFDLGNQIKLPAYLQAQGAQLSSQGKRSGVPANRRKLCDDLVRNAEALARPLAALNWLAAQAERDFSSPRMSESQMRWPELNLLIDRFAEEKVLTLRGGRLHFESEEDRFFTNGGWLEEYTYGVLVLQIAWFCIQSRINDSRPEKRHRFHF